MDKLWSRYRRGVTAGLTAAHFVLLARSPAIDYPQAIGPPLERSSSRMKVRKAVILAAGFGTRFLPATKTVPKEMLPILDKPVIQYIVEEALAAGIEQIIMVTSSSKRSMEDHFDHHFELEQALDAGGKRGLLDDVRKLADVPMVFVRQKGASWQRARCSHHARPRWRRTVRRLLPGRRHLPRGSGDPPAH